MKIATCACECGRRGPIFARGLRELCYGFHHCNGTLDRFPADPEHPDPLEYQCQNEIHGERCGAPTFYDREIRHARSVCKTCWERLLRDNA